MLINPWLKKIDIENIIKLQKRKKEKTNTWSGSVCLHCELWPILSVVERGEMEQKLLVGKGVRVPPGHLPGALYLRYKWRRQHSQPPNKQILNETKEQRPQGKLAKSVG